MMMIDTGTKSETERSDLEVQEVKEEACGKSVMMRREYCRLFPFYQRYDLAVVYMIERILSITAVALRRRELNAGGPFFLPAMSICYVAYRWHILSFMYYDSVGGGYQDQCKRLSNRHAANADLSHHMVLGIVT